MCPTGLGYFDAIYCISLRESKERRKKFKKQIKELWIADKIKFFDAIKNSKNWHLWCMASHREIIKIAQKNKYRNILVFEDDAKLIKENLIYLEKAIQEIHWKKWGLFYLWCIFLWEDLPYLQKNNQTYQICGWRGSHAIAYNECTYKKFLQKTGWKKWIELIKKYIGFDVYLSLFFQEYYKSYMPLKPIFTQEAGFSYIQNKIDNKDIFIIDKFKTISAWWIFFRTIVKWIRKIVVYLWILSNEKINIFNAISKYNNQHGGKVRTQLKKWQLIKTRARTREERTK